MYGVLAFPLEATLLEKLLDTGLGLPMAIGVTATLLFLIPIYLASQTVPMLAELTNFDGKAGKASRSPIPEPTWSARSMSPLAS
jgi:hypothetical protein